MFTGIIEEVAKVRSHEAGELVIECDLVRSDAALGDSIAVNGVDLTVRTIDDDALRFDVMTETYRRANLQTLAPGDAVNLERSVTGATRLSGHIVRGVSRPPAPWTVSHPRAKRSSRAIAPTPSS